MRCSSVSRLALAAGPRAAPQPLRSVLEITGPDAKKFLNGQMCKNVDALGGGYSGFLNASGRVLHTVFCIPSKPNTYLISHESGPGHIAPLATLLPPFRLRSKIKIRDVTDEWDVWSAWGGEAPAPAPTSTWRFGSGGAAERIWSWEGEMAPLGLADAEVGCWDLRAGFGPAGMGRQVFVPKGGKPSLLSSHDLASTDEYNLRRMVLGVPEGSAEVIPGSALPLESDMDIHGGVDVRKGCYLGQELTVRTYHTGATRKRILPVYLYPLEAGPGALSSSALTVDDVSSLPALPPLKGGAQRVDIMYTPPAGAASKKSRSAGKLLALSDAAPGVGLGLVRLEWAGRTWDGEGTLSVEVDGAKYGVWVGKGEAYAAALAATPPPRVHDDEEDMAHVGP
ncbi:Aminomethyltransferase folate-binding domain-containing protein [Cutaneotrichosporon oleaginosum]|uniref:Aminomethyltransferase folate-binding domain-containing protein n=1 Tax=Cutaneotrichosporon oleaginosum TaxID=879819 RepID=A0A0J0XKK8_9TREE|nr:Aminomethyltransferase folate-binding domain-containing protein [Cutaneotrichosporon oleaginosum]KLT41625.1 Aminomethyltransferase folate-binding domain-containing protein [Cutaneotrichosporon oleaginosum]TXT08137.1 hypothetical protein COLE_05061 [Cutaneotrichosporon oleaginosum]